VAQLSTFGNTIMTRHFLQVCDLAQEALLELFERAQSLETAFHAKQVPGLLKGKRIALSFED
jgi:ornithine carbamoyltransferase